MQPTGYNGTLTVNGEQLPLQGWNVIEAIPTDGEALLRAICAAPAEDTPRLVYADWCDENGQPERAEFIRVQIALSHLPAPCVVRPEGITIDPPGESHTAEISVPFSEAVALENGSVIDITLQQVDGAKLEIRGALVLNIRLAMLGTRPSTVQVQIDRDHDPNREKREQLYKREREFLTPSINDSPGQNWPKWAGGKCSPLLHRVASSWRWDRGFIHQLYCEAPRWILGGDAIRAEYPITRVRLLSLPPTEYESLGGAWSGFCRLSLMGREKSIIVPVQDQGSEGILLKLLAHEWPGIEFTLPR